MAGKTNIRSIRLSDELMEVIEAQVGETFTEKYEGLIRRCVFELPAKEKELEKIKAEINKQQQELEKIKAKVIGWKRTAQYMDIAVDKLQGAINIIIAESKDM